jgi:hypothetical protein
MIITLIKCYFNLFSTKHENKINSLNKSIKLRRLSINKIFVSKVESKHTSSKVIITIYVYNRQKKYFLNKIQKIDKIVQLNNTNFIQKIKLEIISIIEQVNKEKKLLAEKFE